jgi:adenylate cyclase
VGWPRDMTVAALVCGSCGAELPPNSKFCKECGAAVATATTPAEYKQVTVLFADVVHSMEIAAVVGAERLREIMAELADRCAAVVQHFGGTVDKFTGDGLMAVFGAPAALEDHAVRACLAALGIQEQAKALAVEIETRDGVEMRLRIGLNSGQVIAGEIGSGAFGYTAVGEQVGMAQRMESAAPHGGVMLSASTARLVDGAAVISEPESVQIKGADEPVWAHHLLGMGVKHLVVSRAESTLVGRQWETVAAEALLDRAIDGHGGALGVVGSPGIGKSRLVREVTAKAAARGVDVFAAFCESHTTQIPFHAVARLLRAATKVEGLDAPAARAHLRDRYRDADPEDLLLFDDLLGIADPDIALPNIDPDARRRRLTALVNTAALARENPTVYVLEDVHWIDEVSESMIADFLTVIPHTPSLVLTTYRPEYRGALSHVVDAQTIVLAPLADAETAALITGLLGPDPSVGALGRVIVERAAGNPFFAEEIVRDLAERGVLRGHPGTYLSTAQAAQVSVPATLQATIAARIDRLDPKAKRTLSAAAVVGSRFGVDLLTRLGVEPEVANLVAAQFIDQVKFTRDAEYVFHHPLIRSVAYEAQLKSDRADLHRRVAAAIEQLSAGSLDENAALIAEHFEAAGELRAAFDWHMRAGAWSNNRDAAAARVSWDRARAVADRLPADEPDHMTMRIAPRSLLCASAWRAGGSGAETGFDELRDLCAAADDKRSLAIGMAGLQMSLALRNLHRESSRLASEFTELLESIGDPEMTVGLLFAAALAKYEVGEMAESMRLAQRVIDLADGDTTRGDLTIGSPLTVAIAIRGFARMCLGIPGWRDDFSHAIAMARSFDATTRVLAIMYKYVSGIPIGAVLADAVALSDSAEMLHFAEQSGDDPALTMARLIRGLALIHRGGSERVAGFDLLAEVRKATVEERFTMTALPLVDSYLAGEKARTGYLDSAIELSRSSIEDMFATGEMMWHGPAITVLVESLLHRNADTDLQEAQSAIERLAAVPTDPGFVLHELPLLRLRALLARARGDDARYREYRDRYRDMARTLGFEGHIAWAEAMR